MNMTDLWKWGMPVFADRDWLGAKMIIMVTVAFAGLYLIIRVEEHRDKKKAKKHED